MSAQPPSAFRLPTSRRLTSLEFGVSPLLLLLCILCLLPVFPVLASDAPRWWTARGVLDSGAVPNDHAPVNQGQAKRMATQAKAELDAVLANGSGPAIEALVGGFSAGGNNLPLNLGQLEYVFSFDPDACIDSDGDGLSNRAERILGTDPDDADSDNDGMTDGWEVLHGFDPKLADSTGDADLDGLPNIAECGLATDPHDADTDGDGLSDGMEAGWRVVVAWGDNSFGQCNVPPGLTAVTAIAAGEEVTVALLSDGTVEAWGSLVFWDEPPNLPRVSAIAAGAYHALALLSNETVTAWGDFFYGNEWDVPEGVWNVTAVAAGDSHSLVAISDGTIRAWGADESGQCAVPEGLRRALGLCGGSAHSVALLRLDPTRADTDGDGMPDKWEIDHGFNPCDPRDAAGDPDADGLSNVEEHTAGTNPHDPDSDDDGLLDGFEVASGLNPLHIDTDGDGFPDGVEVANDMNPLVADPDTDGDGMADAWETANGFNLNDPSDAAALSIHPFAQPYGLTNLQVFGNPSLRAGANYSTVGDGVPDWWKVMNGFAANTPATTAGPNGLTLDASYRIKAALDRFNYSQVGLLRGLMSLDAVTWNRTADLPACIAQVRASLEPVLPNCLNLTVHDSWFGTGNAVVKWTLPTVLDAAGNSTGGWLSGPPSLEQVSELEAVLARLTRIPSEVSDPYPGVADQESQRDANNNLIPYPNCFGTWSVTANYPGHWPAGWKVSTYVLFSQGRASWPDSAYLDDCLTVNNDNFWAGTRYRVYHLLGNADVTADWRPNQANEIRAWDDYPNRLYCSDFRIVHVLEVAKMSIDRIAFNFDPASHAEDGLNLRGDFGTGMSVPEYVKGGQSKPSAYVKNKSVKIKVRILVDPPTITSLKIKGLSDDAGGSLGDVAEKTVTFSGGVSQSGIANDPSTAINEAEFIEFAVNGNTPNVVNKSTDAWKWVITGVNGTTLPAMEMDRTSGHTIYTVLDVPAQPWTQAPGDQCNVWSKALELVCGSEWAGGTATTKDAAAGITRKLYSVGAHNPDGGGGRQFDKAGNLSNRLDQ